MPVSLSDLLQGQPPGDDTLVENTEAEFRETFDIEGLSTERQGDIVYFVGEVANRQVKINPVSTPSGVAWVLNGRTFFSPANMTQPLQERQQILREAILRIPTRRL